MDAAHRTAAALADKLIKAHCGQRGLSRHIGEGVSPTLVAEWCDPQSEKTIPLRAIIAAPADLCAAFGRALVNYAEPQSAGPARPLSDCVLAVAEQVGALAAQVREAQADGVLTDAERERLDDAYERALEAVLVGRRNLWRGGGK